MENNLDFKVNKVKSLSFILVILGLIIIPILLIFIALMGISDMFLLSAPNWFFIVSILISISSIIAAIGIYFLKKLAVYIYPFSIILQYLHYLITYNLDYMDVVVGLFIFLTFGLFVIIPRWNYFK